MALPEEAREREAPHARTDPAEARYRPHAVLGSGGMGRVSLARDDRLERDVALKELRPTLLRTRALIARFEREAKLTAHLEHPAIVPIYDFGVGPGGEPWYAMRRIRGVSLEVAVRQAPEREQRLPLLRRFLLACEGVAYAHDAGIVHRDLKPANLMLGEHGETLVVDWGLARQLSEGADETALGVDPGPGDASLTAAGAVIGSPTWMSPEQAAGREADRRTDVWGLGATLYFILEGAPPFERGPDSDEALRFSPEQPRDLVAICSRALTRDADARYPDAGAFARELERWLDGRRVHAYDYTPWERLGRVARRWRVPLLIAAVALVALTVTATTLLLQVTAESRRAQGAEIEARAALTRAETQLGLLSARSAVAAAADDERAEAEALAFTAIDNGQAARGLGVLMSFWGAGAPALVASRPAPRCLEVALSPSGDRLVCLDGSQTALWALTDLRAPLWTLPLPAREALFVGPDRVALRGHGGSKLLLVSAREGRVLAESTRGEKGLFDDGQHLGSAVGVQLTVWDREGHPILAEEPCADRPIRGADLREGRVVVLCASDDPRVLELRAGPAKGPLEARFTLNLGDDTEPHLIALAPDGQRVVAGNADGVVWVVDLDTGSVIHRVKTPLGHIATLRWSPAPGSVVLATGDFGGPVLLDPAAGAIVARLPRDSGPYVRFVAVAEGVHLASVGDEIKTWRLPRHWYPRVLRACPDTGVTSVVPSPDGTALVATCGAGRVRRIQRQTGAARPLAQLESTAKDASWSPDGARLIVGQALVQRADELDARTGESLAVAATDNARRVLWMAGGTRVVAGWGPVAAWVDGRPRLLGAADLRARDLGASPDRRRVALVSYGARTGVWTWHEGAEEATLVVEDADAWAADIGDSGLLSVSTTHTLALYEPGGSLRWRLDTPSQALDHALSPDERLVATAAVDAVARIYDARDGGLLAELSGHTERISSVSFGGDGDWLVTGSWDDTARVWSLVPLSRPVDALRREHRARWHTPPGAR